MKDKVVLIAGGSGEIGQACADLFSRAGARVVLAARNRDKAEAKAKELNDKGGEAYVIDLDVTDSASVSAMVTEVVSSLGGIDVLINAFGMGMILPLPEAEPEAIKEVLEVNTYGTILVTKAVLPHMAEKKSGKVIMIPGIIGKYVMRHSSVYSASKFAVAGFTKALVEEYKRDGIGFTLFYLGGVGTQFWDNPNVQMRVQKDKMLQPEEVAKAIYYAATQPSPGIMNEIVIQPDSHQMV
jgi:NADP-dependent 3-hydroxy acid dehydrogenase YdfG